MNSHQLRIKDDFLRTLATIFNAARWFGIPSQGGKTTIFVSLILFLMLLVLEVTAIWKLVRAFGGWSVVKGSVITRLSGAIFYGNALFSQILIWRFLSSWQELSYCWTRSEPALAEPLPPDYTIQKKMVILTSLVTTCAVTEHALSMMAATGLNSPPAEYFRRYILSSHGFLLHSYEYKLWNAVPIFLLSKLATVLWNFQDLVIILVSMGLTSRYRRLNSRVNYVIQTEKCNKLCNSDQVGVETYLQVQTWRRLREAYVRQSALVRKVGDQLGSLILLSNMNNLYFICLQLFLGINSEQGPLINRLYYTLSLSWLITRACGVVLAAADIHIHSKSALPLLQSTCNSTYNVEVWASLSLGVYEISASMVARLKTQLKHDYVAMHGMRLFTLDRKLLLKVAAAILKYELILIQFDK